MSSMDFINALRRFVAPISKRVRLMVSRGVVKLVNDSLKCQGLQVELLRDEILDDVERFQEYGFTSVPVEGAEVLFLSVGGNRSAGVVVCVTDRRYRPQNLNPGDVCLYLQMANGERVYLDKTNDIVNLGAKAAAAFVARADLVDSRISAIETWLASHVHSGVTAGAAVSGTAAGAPSGTSTAAAKVKAT